MEIQIEAKYTSVTKVTYLYGFIWYILVRVHIYVFIGFYIYNIQLQMVFPFLVSDK